MCKPENKAEWFGARVAERQLYTGVAAQNIRALSTSTGSVLVDSEPVTGNEPEFANKDVAAWNFIKRRRLSTGSRTSVARAVVIAACVSYESSKA